MQPILTVADLEDRLSAPTPGVLETLRAIEGDVLVIGAGGKMGPTLARMVRRGLDAIGQPSRRVIAVSRFSSPEAAESLQKNGVETIARDLSDRRAIYELPRVANVIFMAGKKFGGSDDARSYLTPNVVMPTHVAEWFCRARIVVFSTGCVYPLAAVDGPGSCEDDPLGPPGAYAQSCVERERVVTRVSGELGTRCLLFRLSYAIDLRYGVLLDVAQAVARGEPLDVTMGWANVIWQGDANARAIQCLAHVASPPVALNVTGYERVSIRDLAQRFGKILGREPILVGSEAPTAWLFDATRSRELFGPLTVSLDEMIAATAQWVRQGSATLGRPTHFETRDGQF